MSWSDRKFGEKLILVDKIIQVFKDLSNRDKIGIAFIFAFALLSPFFEIAGWDYLQAFRLDALYETYGKRSWNPYPAYWLIMPFALFSPRVGFFFWNLLSAICFVYAIWYWRGDFLVFGTSLPCFWIFLSGQMEGIISLGIVLGMLPHPMLVGLGLTLLTIKPQIGLFPIIFIILRHRTWRILIIPVLVYSASLFYWGWWIPEWLTSIRNSSVTRSAINISLFPYSLILLPILWWARSSIKIWLLIQSLVIPYFPVYSLCPLFVMQFPIWANVFLWGAYLSAFWITYPITPGVVVPGVMLFIALIDLQKSYLSDSHLVEKLNTQSLKK